MRKSTEITYLFDPLCGWCYGAAPTLDLLASDPDFRLTLLPTGLFAGTQALPMGEGFAAFAWANDKRIAALSGQPFTEAYRRRVLGDRSRLVDSGPATRALAAVRTVAPDRVASALKAIQSARYADGEDVTDLSVLAAVLDRAGLPGAAERLLDAGPSVAVSCDDWIAAGRDAMRRFGASGVPSLVATIAGAPRLLGGASLVTGGDALVAGLKGA